MLLTTSLIHATATSGSSATITTRTAAFSLGLGAAEETIITAGIKEISSSIK